MQILISLIFSCLLISFPTISQVYQSRYAPHRYANKDYKISSQTNNIELAKRYAKLGNTWREAKDYDNARIYLDKALNMLKGQRNFDEMYWYAVANEYMGYYYRDLGNMSEARNYLGKAADIYSEVINIDNGSQEAISAAISLCSIKMFPSNDARKVDIASIFPFVNGKGNVDIRDVIMNAMKRFSDNDNDVMLGRLDAFMNHFKPNCEETQEYNACLNSKYGKVECYNECRHHNRDRCLSSNVCFGDDRCGKCDNSKGNKKMTREEFYKQMNELIEILHQLIGKQAEDCDNGNWVE